jgi:hypothetical protein
VVLCRSSEVVLFSEADQTFDEPLIACTKARQSVSEALLEHCVDGETSLPTESLQFQLSPVVLHDHLLKPRNPSA